TAGVGVIIELKAPHLYPGIEEKVAAVIREMVQRGAQRLWCISFDHAAIRTMRTLDPTLPLGYLFMPGAESFVQADDAIQAVCPFYMCPLQHPEQLEQAHQLGKYHFVY